METIRRSGYDDRLVTFRKLALGLVLIVATVLSFLPFAFGSTNSAVTVGQTGTVIITVADYPPVVESLRIGANNVTEVNVDTAYSWAITISDKNSVKNLESVSIYLHTTNSSEGIFDEQSSYGFRWLRRDSWQELTVKGWSNTTIYLDPAQCTHSTISAKFGQGEWQFVAKLSKKALCSGNSCRWMFEAVARDKAGAEGHRSIMFDVNLYAFVPQGTIQANAAFTVTLWKEPSLDSEEDYGRT